MNKIEMVEKEFDEPFDEVIKGFAEMGYSRRALAEILEINLTCKNCGEVQPNEVEFIDYGIGAYEYGSIKAVHHDYRLTCKKCGGSVDDDWELDQPCLDDGWE